MNSGRNWNRLTFFFIFRSDVFTGSVFWRDISHFRYRGHFICRQRPGGQNWPHGLYLSKVRTFIYLIVFEWSVSSINSIMYLLHQWFCILYLMCLSWSWVKKDKRASWTLIVLQSSTQHEKCKSFGKAEIQNIVLWTCEGLARASQWPVSAP